MKAIIFNSGLGKRMGNLTKNNPKSMVKLYNGETIFARQIRILSECGIKEFIITTGPFKEQLEEASQKFTNCKFQFVHNPLYQETNYIYSMYLAKDYLDDDVLLLHGDLVFNKKLVEKILNDKHSSVGLINEDKKLPEKDFKAKVKNNLLKEVSINIFDSDCYAFQPLYKLAKDDLNKWNLQIEKYVKENNVNVYAENALNDILDEINITTISYKDYYIDEIDNEEDYLRVNKEIEKFDKNE